MSAPQIDDGFRFGHGHRNKAGMRCCGKPVGCNMPLETCNFAVRRDRIKAGLEKPQDVPAMFAEQGRCYYCGNRFDDAPSKTCQRLDLHEQVA